MISKVVAHDQFTQVCIVPLTLLFYRSWCQLNKSASHKYRQDQALDQVDYYYDKNSVRI